jgi:endonuclease-3
VDKFIAIIRLMEKQVRKFQVPSVTVVSRKRDPYLVLISCLLSLRTKDKTTFEASNRLFRIASAPKEMVLLSAKKIEKTIYPVGFYRNKAKVIREVSRRIIEDFSGKVPRAREELLTLKGVGRKTANLVLGLGYGIPAICVDTHVHRIANRLGWLSTRDPHDTEAGLEKIFERRYWIKLNTVMVAFGQNMCLPVSPLCNRCFVRKFCQRVGVKISR